MCAVLGLLMAFVAYGRLAMKSERSPPPSHTRTARTPRYALGCVQGVLQLYQTQHIDTSCSVSTPGEFGARSVARSLSS